MKDGKHKMSGGMMMSDSQMKKMMGQGSAPKKRTGKARGKKR